MSGPVSSGAAASAPDDAVARVAAGSQWRQLGMLLGEAFQDDPVWMWVAPDPVRRARFLGPTFAQLIRSRVDAGTTWTNGDLSGAAVWAEPDTWRARPTDVLRMALPMLRAVGASRLRGRLEALSNMERHHPKDPHWYLEVLGADPARRGQGIGTTLLRPMLDRCDTEGVPAYLESSKEANLAFYHRHGFEADEPLTLADGCPPVWPMWRDPR
ncbi:MAG: GNAT family N-acetyltransferase [Microthrixaceae bacterium]